MPLAPGTRLGPYAIVSLLAAGGMGEVYRAHDTRLERDIALKVLPEEMVVEETSRSRLVREARVAAQLNHPNICTIHEVGEVGGLAYIAMERVEGRPLDDLLGPHGLSPELVVRYGMQIADAISYAHRQGVVHRDLKSANVVVTGDGHVKVLDFGLAKRVGPSDPAGAEERVSTLTESGMIVGTPQYLAPEIVRGGAADARSDLWSLGVVLYEMVSGTRPFRGSTALAVGAAILNDSPEPLPAGTPPALASIIQRCLAKDPALRCQHAAEVRSALARVASASDEAVRTSATGRRPPAHRRGRLWAAATLVLVVVLGLLAPRGIRTRLFRTRGAGRITSLAVLPLENFSRDPDQQYFADGMTDELITRLAQIGSWRVISRTSAMAFRGSTRPLPEIARKLSVDAIVEGSVARSGDRVRITAQLIRAATDEHLWAQTYERDLRDVIRLQDEVAGAIAAEVQGRLASRPGRPTAGPRTVSPHGYDLYLRALDAYRHWSRYSDRAALAFLDQALRVDSTYAPAWAATALVYLDEPGQFGTRGQDVARAREAVDRALALDPNLGLAHSVKAQVAFEQDWNWAAAEREFERGIELAPNSFEAHHVYSHLLMALGRARESLEQGRLALAIDPLNTAAVLHMGWCNLQTAHVEGALQEFRTGLRLDPNSAEVYRFLWEAYATSGRCDEAEAAGQEALRRADPADTVSTTVHLRSRLAMSAVLAAKSGRSEVALRRVSGMIADVGRGTVPAYDVAAVFALLDRKDEAFRWLDRAVRRHETYVVSIKTDPFLASLRSDPRFTALIRRIGLPV